MPNDHDWYKQNIILTGKENGTIGTTDSSSSASVTIDTQTADGKQTMLNGKFPIYIDKANPQITATFQDGYAFQGWHDGETHVGSAGGSYKVELNITLTAVWRSLDTAPNPYAVVIDDTKFSPDVDLTRGMLVTILSRYAQYKGYVVSVGEDTNILFYKDFDEIHTYAIPAMQWACGAGIIQGSNGALHLGVMILLVPSLERPQEMAGPLSPASSALFHGKIFKNDLLFPIKLDMLRAETIAHPGSGRQSNKKL